MTLSNPATDDGTVLVAAMQTLNGGPTVTVKSQVAPVLTTTPLIIGDYSYNLTLPIGAPWLGQYSTTLPIALTAVAQSAVAGVYTVLGTATVFGTPTVYVTQTPPPSPVNITGGSATQDFTLTP